MRKCFNFFLASVIRLQCSRFPRALIDIHRHCHQWLGGQHGEEAKDEGEGGGEKGREEDQAPEEEVTERRSYSLRLRTTSVTASNGPADVEVMSASLLHPDTPAPVDDRGRRRDRGSSLAPTFANSEGQGEERVDGSTPRRAGRPAMVLSPDSRRRPRYFCFLVCCIENRRARHQRRELNGVRRRAAASVPSRTDTSQQ